MGADGAAHLSLWAVLKSAARRQQLASPHQPVTDGWLQPGLTETPWGKYGSDMQACMCAYIPACMHKQTDRQTD